MNRLLSLVLLVGLSTLSLRAQSTDADIIQQIRTEGFDNSQVMMLMHNLTDVYGPRLTGSPSLREAGQWVLEQAEAWGLENGEAVAWDWRNPGWENNRLSAHITAPTQDALVVEALGWTPSTDGVVTSTVVPVQAPDSPTQAQFDAYLADLAPQVQGKIALVGSLREVPTRFNLATLRRTDEDVARLYDPNAEPSSRSRRPRGGTEDGILSSGEVTQQLNQFFREQGVLVRIDPSRMEDGLIRAFANRTFDPETTVPTVVMRAEDFGRITRLIDNGHEVSLEFDIQNSQYPENTTEYNYVAEIPGSEDGVVMIGGHLDSWHAATGATDNAAGSAIMMEAMRILSTLDVQPKRTIRMALWTGEEQGLIGSIEYVKQVFGTYEDPKPAYEGFNGYINVDSGTGKLRGATVFGPKETALVLDELLAPFEDLDVAGARATSSRVHGGSDYTAFNHIGLPGISMGQDPIKYFSHTWHTNVDTYERILPEDVKQAAVVVAATAYHLAMQEEPLPRFAPDAMPPTPEPRRR
ncbi:MAG: M28 family metallopeptidase [Rhodothermales bacterium]